MKCFAAKKQGSTTSTRGKNAFVHTPLGSKIHAQGAGIRQIVQPKLTVGQPNDQYEQEADRVADRVVASQPVADISPLSNSTSSNVTQPVQAETPPQDLAEEEKIRRQVEEGQPQEDRLELLQPKLEDEEEEEATVQAKGGIMSPAAALMAVNDRSSGSPLRPDVQSALESSIGADLSHVRVHDDGTAHEAAASINARAFTHKSDIWLGEGQSQSDLHLMAHEATHVVQQGGGLRAASKEISRTTPRVQRIWNPITAVANAVGSAAEWVGDTLGSAIDYIKERAVEFVRELPGYSLFTVVNGSDPITGRRVERNGRNFIEAGLDVIPNGEALKQKLEQEGALEEAAQWLDNEIRELDFSPSEIASQFSNFWSSLTLADAARLPTVLNRLTDIITAPIGRLVRFASNVAVRLLEIVKNYVISALINFIREHTNAYPLLTTILGRDPISDEAVERTPIALLRGFMQLSDSGAEQLRQMEESGSLQRAADWLDGAVARLNITWEMIRDSFTRAWNLVTIQNLLDPLGTFRELYDIFAAPVGRIINFLIEIAAQVLSLIKDALINRLVVYARTVRGYPLITVILGKDPFSQEPVERTTGNIIRGFMSLMENGEQQYQEMVQSGAIANMTARVEAAMAALNFTWEYIRGLFTSAWNSFSLQDLAAPFEAFRRLMEIFAAPIMRLVSFVWEIVKIVIEVVMEIMNFPADLIRNIIVRAMQAIEDIKRDPVAFLKNLLLAVKTGFQQFFGNILTHLLSGLTGWLFSELRDANINPPTDLSFRSILGFVLEVLGITVERIWQKLAERIGQERVDRIRGMIDRLTGIWTFVKDVATRGPIAIWEYIQERLGSLWDTVLESVRNWVMTRIVERITVRLLSLLDPTGIMAVVNGFIAFYNAVQSFIRYLREMLEIVNSFVVGVAELARGNVTIAANYLEASLARAMPVAIGFLANQVGLSGIGRRIGEMIERVRELVDRALTWLVDRAVTAGASLLNSLRGALGMGGDAASGPMDHQTMVTQIQERLSSPAQATDPAAAIQEKRSQATQLQNEYQPRLEAGIRLSITTDENLQSAERDNDIDFNIRIAPNTTTGSAHSPLAGQWPQGTQADPIPIKWYKSPADYPTINGQGPTQGVTMPATPRRNSQVLRVASGSFPQVGEILTRRTGREDTVKSEVYTRLRELRTSGGWTISADPYAIDHVKDLQWTGSDAFNNLWPLDTDKNSGANSSKDQRAKAMEGGNPVIKSIYGWGTAKHFWIAAIVSPTSGHDRVNPVNDGTTIPKRKP